MAVATIAAIPAVHAAEDVAAQIKRMSQEFSDASASGDGKVLERYLDDRVIFMNETGALATKRDIVDGAAPKPPGVSQQLVQSDWKLELHGDTAVTSFTDNSTTHVKDQVFTAQYLSTEVWQKNAGQWRMISSQTMTKAQEPVATTLSPEHLDDYVGTYASGTLASVKIERRGNALFSSTNGAQATELKTEVRDVLFVPGQARMRRVFIRDGAAKITGFLSIREAGDLMFKRTG
jgi:ketosteroid isomerase-like protein